MQKYDFIVLGAGLAGLAFSKRISENGFSVLLLEKEDAVGGLSRTLIHDGYYIDFCAHRFHTKNTELLEEVLSLPGLKMNKHLKKSRIYMFDKYLKYPFQLQNLLRAMPISQSIPCSLSFLVNLILKRFRKKDNIRSYKDWFIHFYGRGLYEVMCRPYTSKIWRTDPSEISADWAEDRFQGEKVKYLIKRIFQKLLTLDFSSYDIEDEAYIPDGGEFYFPIRGIQELSDALARTARENGATIVTSAEITDINRKEKKVSYEKDGTAYRVEYKNLISTIPLNLFYELQDKKDLHIASLIKNLIYMNIIFVFAFVNKERISNDHWLYFPDKDIIFNRAVEFSNWSPEMCPDGKTSVCFDITCYNGSKIWDLPDSEIVDIALSDADRINYLARTDVTSTHVFRLKYAYPYYDLDYKRKLDEVAKFLETDDCYLLGRTGLFRYNNADNSIEMGFKLAENFVSEKANKSIYDYKVRHISL
ncbi:MAG: FAD-dependent oxidoreductase [Candidatus Glassbacteria bacterium]